jgi:hypothetical protein
MRPATERQSLSALCCGKPLNQSGASRYVADVLDNAINPTPAFAFLLLR